MGLDVVAYGDMVEVEKEAWADIPESELFEVAYNRDWCIVYEGFGFPAGEALSCGVPLVSTDGGSLPEVVGDAGIIAPHSNPPALAQAIADLLNNPDKRDALSVKGRKHILENFTWSRCAQEVVDMYRATIAKNANIQLTNADNST